jgi:hypothetical protein
VIFFATDTCCFPVASLRLFHRPWSFDTCRHGKAQHEQMFSACNTATHFGMHPRQGRGERALLTMFACRPMYACYICMRVAGQICPCVCIPYCRCCNMPYFQAARATTQYYVHVNGT